MVSFGVFFDNKVMKKKISTTVNIPFFIKRKMHGRVEVVTH